MYAPFRCCATLGAAYHDAPPLRRGTRGVAVKLLQGGLRQLGFALPHSTLPKGATDGILGEETVAALMKFQEQYKSLLKVDGIAGKSTIGLMDALLANASKPTLAPAAPQVRIPTNAEYQLGTADPPYQADAGAGAWKSVSTQASYAALAAAVVAALPVAYGVIGDDAAKHMWHYFLSQGSTYTLDLEGMVRDVPGARELYEREVAQAKKFVETLPPGQHDITSRHTQVGYNYEKESRNWYYAVGGYHAWGRGVAIVTDVSGQRRCQLDFEYKVRDRYNWDNGKSITFHDITVTDQFMGEFHRQGLAREFDCVGSLKRQLNWNAGAPIPFDQIQAPAGRA
jgi:peptidoglycan hydrolase-like protein with peptidoglycan-binding domain